jgi:hypothetical protein
MWSPSSITLAKGKSRFLLQCFPKKGREAKVREHGTAVIEQRYEAQYRTFKERVTGHLCAFFDDARGVKLAVFETLPKLVGRNDLVGWVSARDAGADPATARELARLSAENQQLRTSNKELAAKVQAEWGATGSYEDLITAMADEMVAVPAVVTGNKDIKQKLVAAHTSLR